MADLPHDPSSGFEIQPRLNDEMEYFKEMALQETERWIESVTKQRFKYPEDPRRSLQNGILLCELVNALKPGCVRKINRLPTPIAFLDNLTVFQNACRFEFGLQECQLFDIKDLEDLTLRGVLESEEDIHHETSRRLKNVAITIFWLGKAVRRWFRGPMLDFTAFTDIIDMSHTSQVSFRTPSEASFRSSSTGKFSSDRLSSSKALPLQSDTAYDRIAKYLESKPTQVNYDFEDVSSGYGDAGRQVASDFEQDVFEAGFDSSVMYGQPKSAASAKVVPIKSPAKQTNDFSKPDYCASPGRSNGALDLTLSESGPAKAQVVPGFGRSSGQSCERTSSPESASGHSSRAGFQHESSWRKSSEPRSPVSPSGKGLAAGDPLKFVKGESNILADTAKQTIQLMQQQSMKQVTAPEDDNWEAKLSDWKSRRRSQTRSLRSNSDVEELAGERKMAEQTDHVSPTTKTVIKRRGEEEDMLAIFGFTKLPDKLATKTKSLSRDAPEDQTARGPGSRTVEVSQCSGEQDNGKMLSQYQQQQQQQPKHRIGSGQTKSLPEGKLETALNVSTLESGLDQRRSKPQAESTDSKPHYLEKVIKICQRPKHDKGFGFTIKGGKEFGMPITVDKIHLGGAADVCDLMPKDEIIAINGAELANHYLESVRAVIDQAVHSGQVELTIRRMLRKNSIDQEAEDNVFSEEDDDVVIDEMVADESESQLALPLVTETARPLTPVPPPDDDEAPPPLPSAPPPLPNWNTFPGAGAAFAPANNFRYFDDEAAVDEREVDAGGNLPGAQRRAIITESREKEEAGEEERRSRATRISDSDKHDMLVKRINFFGIKPENSEEYKRTFEERNTQRVKSELAELSSSLSSASQPVLTVTSPLGQPTVRSDERVFAVVVKPCIDEPTHPPKVTTSHTPHPRHPPPSPPPRTSQSDIKNEEYLLQETEMVIKTERGRSGALQSLSHSMEKQSHEADVRLKGVNRLPPVGTDSGNEKHFEERRDHESQRSMSDSFSKETEAVAGKGNEAGVTVAVSPRQKAGSRISEAALQDGPKRPELPPGHRHSESSSPLSDKPKGWRSMELLRSLSVNEAPLQVDPTERAREDYLSLMTSQPKLNMAAISRQFFDIEKDLQRMEEWNKRQDQLRKEKFDHDQETLRQKHETALKEATALELEKQKQEEQILEKDITWQSQLEQIRLERERELAKKQKEEWIQQKLAKEKVERERKADELKSVTERYKTYFADYDENVLGTSSSEMRKTGSDVQTGKVEMGFVNTPIQASLEVLPDSVHASSESLSSSTQPEGNSARNAKTSSERRDGGGNPEEEFSDLYDPRSSQTLDTCRADYYTERKTPGNAYSLTSSGNLESESTRQQLFDLPPAVREKPERKTELGRSAQQIRDEALRISRNAGSGGSGGWGGGMLEPRTESPKPSHPAVRQSLPITGTSSVAASSIPQPLRSRKDLQDISAPPKHRLLESESWIKCRPEEEEDDERAGSETDFILDVVNSSRGIQETGRQMAPAERTPGPKPTVPLRSDSLKKSVVSQAPTATAAVAPNHGQTLATSFSSAKTTVTSVPPAAAAAAAASRDVFSDAPEVNQKPGIASLSQRSFAPAASALSSSGPYPRYFGPPEADRRRQPAPGGCIDLRPYQLQGSLEEMRSFPSSASEQLDGNPRLMSGVQEPLVRMRSKEVPPRSASHNVPQHPRDRPYSCDFSIDVTKSGGFSGLVPGHPAVPYNRDLSNPNVAMRPTSDAVSMLFAYHQNPPKDDVGRTGQDSFHSQEFQQSQEFLQGQEVLRSQELRQSQDAQLMSSGQKCAGCEEELEGLKYSKV